MTTTERRKQRRDNRPERFIETLALVAEGDTAATIGRKLGRSEQGIKGRLTDLYRQLGARNAAHAVAIAYERGYLPRRRSSNA